MQSILRFVNLFRFFIFLDSHRALANGTEIAIVVVACGERHNEALNMIKSAIMFNRNQAPLKFVVVAEEQLKQNFVEKLDDWQEINDNIFTYEIHSLTFPEADKDEWKKLFKPCAAQRLFLPVRILAFSQS